MRSAACWRPSPGRSNLNASALAAAPGRRSRGGHCRACAISRPSPPRPWTATRCAARTSTAVPATLRVLGTSAAGRRFRRRVGPGEAVRIFTGAPLPEGADAIVIQENTEKLDGASVIDEAAVPGPPHPARRARLQGGGDPAEGRRRARCARPRPRRRDGARHPAGQTQTPRRHPRDRRRTGPARASSRAPTRSSPRTCPPSSRMVEKAGGEAIDLGIARDTLRIARRADRSREGKRRRHARHARRRLGGEHDLVQSALSRQGMKLGFWRVALRPGKPLMHGRLGAMSLLGLPGNPVSSIVCAILFLVPAIQALLGQPGSGARSDRSARSSGRMWRRMATARTTCAPLSAAKPMGAGRWRSPTRCRIPPCSARSRARVPCSSGHRTPPPCRRAVPAKSSRLNASADPIVVQPGLAEHSGNSYGVPALFQNRSRRGAVKASHADAKTARTAPLHP